MKIEKAELAQKINKLKSIVPKKTVIPALQGILVQDGYLIANNIELTVKAKIEGTDGESFIIPEKAFDLINNLPDGVVEIASKNTGESFYITIKTDKIKNKYQTMDPDEFPMPNAAGDDGEEFAIKAEVLLSSMKRVSYAIQVNGNNQIMGALCLQASGGTLNFVGMDRHMLAWDKTSYDGEFELLIPKETVDKLLTIGITDDVLIRHNNHAATFSTREYEIYTRIVEGKYFKYTSLFKDSPLHTVVVRSELLDAMIRAKMCTDERNPVKFTMKNNELNIVIKDTITDYQETINLQEEMQEELTIGFNAKLVIDTLKAFDCHNIALKLESAKMPMIVEGEDSDFKAMVLPVALS